MRFFVSDLLWEGEPQAVAAALSQGATATILVQVHAAADARPDLTGGWRVLDVESNEWREVFFDAAAAEQYSLALARHRDLWDDAARQSRAVVARCIAEEIEGTVLFDDLAAAEVLRPCFRS
jgi:hypothetical protein